MPETGFEAGSGEDVANVGFAWSLLATQTLRGIGIAAQ
jgi:hypothetical protein